MTSGGEIIGDIAQGAMLSRAAEPDHGEGNGEGDGHTHEAACLNCGTVLIGSHCHGCGQAAHVHRTIGAFFHDLLHGVFHFEGKLWRTFPLLVWRPGRLTREYIDGRRASYVSPIALFLFVVFLSFAVFNSLGSPVKFDETAPAKVQAGMEDAEAEAAKVQADLERKLADARAGKGGDIARLEDDLAKAKQAVAGIRAASTGKLPESIAEGDFGSSAETAEEINAAWQHARENPELIAFKLQTSAYKYAWLVIPLSVPFIWLLFPFSRRFHLYDHTVFVTYSVSFQLLLLALIGALSVWGGVSGLISGLLVMYAPFHMYRQARETYGLSRFGAWWRTWFLAGFAVFVLSLFAVGLTLYAAAG